MLFAREATQINQLTACAATEGAGFGAPAVGAQPGALPPYPSAIELEGPPELFGDDEGSKVHIIRN